MIWWQGIRLNRQGVGPPALTWAHMVGMGAGLPVQAQAEAAAQEAAAREGAARETAARETATRETADREAAVRETTAIRGCY